MFFCVLSCELPSAALYKGPATRNDNVDDIVDDARDDAIFATLKSIFDDIGSCGRDLRPRYLYRANNYYEVVIIISKSTENIMARKITNEEV